MPADVPIETTHPPITPAPELVAEQQHLARSRAALRSMRDQVLALDAQSAGGDRLNVEFLKATLHHRAAALVDNPETPLFFGRIDAGPAVASRHYIGRRHVHDADGHPMVLDWRADVSRGFYRATARDPMGLIRRRRFGFAAGELTAYEDERLDRSAGPTGPAASRILTEEIERPRIGPMRDIVATIQPDQDDLVRADLGTTICVQGAPGTGKTAVGLHRAAAVCTMLENEGTTTDDRTEAAIARNRDVRAWLDTVWPKVDPVTLVGRLLTEPAFAGAATDGVLDPAEQALLLQPRPARGPRALRWTLADAVLIDEAIDCIDRTRGVGHLILDEAQDLSPMQYRAIGRRCALGSATVLGDLAQGTTPWAADHWATALAHLGKPTAEVEELTAGYRVPRQIIDFAGQLLPHVGPGLAAPTSVRQAPGSLTVRRAAGKRGLDDALLAGCRDALAGEGSIGVVCADGRVEREARSMARTGIEHTVLGGDGFGERLTIVPATLAKGLEFDHVIVVEPAEIVAAESRGLRRLYVVLTRAVSTLTVLHATPLPAPLIG